MADRYDYDYERGSEHDRDRQRDDYGRERAGSQEERYRGGRGSDRGMMERAGDEVRSWFGDQEAARRRERDEMRDERHAYDRGRERGFGSTEYAGERWRGASYTPERNYRTEQGGDFGTQRRYGSERGYASSEDVGAGGLYGYRGSSYGGTMYGDTGYGGTYRGGYSAGTGSSERSWSGSWRDTSGRDWDRSSAAYGRGANREEWIGRGYGAYSGFEPGPYTGRGPRGYRRSDERIREDICDRLTRHGRIDATDITITVANGEVTLEGEVDSREGKRLAEEVAESVDGVREVTNHLKTHRGWNDAERQGASEGAMPRQEAGLGTPGTPTTLGLSGTGETRGATTSTAGSAQQKNR